MTAIRRVAFSASASALAIGLAAPAFAQDAADDEGGNADIVVTAQFREQKLQDTPISITAVTAEMMAAKSQTNLAQLGDSAPNVSIKGQTSAFGPSVSISIRGAGQNDFNPAYEPGVAIYIDDVYYPQLTGAAFDLLDLERVEILRGPQGTLTGRNSEGGAMKMYTKKPTGEGGGFVEATYGSRNKIGLRASADFKLAENLFGRVSGVFKQQEGYIKNLDFGCVFPAGGSATFTQTGGAVLPVNPAGGVARRRASSQGCLVDKLNGVGYQAIRGSLRYAPTDRVDITLSGDYVHDEHTIAGDVLLNVPTSTNVNVIPAPGVAYDNRFICGRYCNFASTGQPAGVFSSFIPPFNGLPLVATQGTNKSVYDGWGVSLRGEIGLTDNLTLTSITGYRDFRAQFDGDDDVSPANLGYGQNDLTNWNFSQELRLGAKLGDMIDLTVGGFYFKQSSVYFSYQDIRYIAAPPGGVFPLQFTQPDKIKADSKAAFAHISVKPTEALTLSGGIRVTNESKDYTYFRLNPDGTVNGILDPAGAAGGIGSPGALSGSTNPYKKNGRFDWRISADYRISPEMLVYATVATGFKGGGTNPRPFNVAQAKIGFKPETLVAYEVGAKTDLLDRQLRFNVSAFLNKFKGLQVPSLFCNTPNPADSTPCAARTNAADATVKGLEAEASLNLRSGLSVDAALSYIHNKFSNLAPGSAFPANAGGIVADDPGVAPTWKYSIGAQYKIDLGSGSLTPRVDYNYQSSQYTGAAVAAGLPVTLANRVRSFVPSYGLVNAQLTYRSADEDWEVSLEGLNLTKEYYLNSVFDLSGIGISKRGNPGAPREFAVRVKRKF